MIGIATGTFATSMQPYLSQPTSYIKRDQILIKTVFIGPSHTESPTGFSQVLPKQYFPTFYHRNFLFCYLPILLLEPFKPPPKDKQDFNRFQDASSQVIFLFQRNFLFGNFHTQTSTSTPKYMQFQYRP